MHPAIVTMIAAWLFVGVWITIVIFSQRKHHPKALFLLFFTEMWERFSYYGMRALLVLYMTKSLISHAQTGTYVFGFGALQSMLESMFGHLAVQPLASQIYGLYTGFVYFTPFLGGMLADKVFGQR